MASTWVLAKGEGEGDTKLFPGTLSNERMLAQRYCPRNDQGVGLSPGASSIFHGGTKTCLLSFGTVT